MILTQLKVITSLNREYLSDHMKKYLRTLIRVEKEKIIYFGQQRLNGMQSLVELQIPEVNLYP